MKKILFTFIVILSSILTIPQITYAVNNSTIIEDEFKNIDDSDEFKEIDENTDNEFKAVETDEFSEVSDDEFSEFSDDEFSEFSDSGPVDGCPSSCKNSSCSVKTSKEDIEYYWTIAILLLTVLAGIFVRFKATRKLRPLFLIASVFILGFYKHACSVCPINGVENAILFIAGYDVTIKELLWIIAIIPITYIFGKVWCGWICHLGAIQEFLYLPRKVKILDSKKAQKIFRVTRYVLLIAMTIQLAVMGTKYYCRIDPLLNIFDFHNFFKYLTTVQSFDIELILIITLLVYVIISSVFVYRSFCRTMCPVGIILGWISRIPGASIIGIKGACVSCKMCNSSCELDAITRTNKLSTIYNPDCNSCGKCIDSCNQDGLTFVRKNKKYPTIVKCTNNCSIGKKV